MILDDDREKYDDVINEEEVDFEGVRWILLVSLLEVKCTSWVGGNMLNFC